MTSEPKSCSDATIQAMREPLLVLDGGFRVKVAIRSFCETSSADAEGGAR